MSKQIKQMEMDTLKTTFAGVQDLVLLTVSKVNAQAENQMRLALRKKNIRMHMVKNSLARRVFDELGIKAAKSWEGPTTLVWGGDSLADLSKAVDETVLKKNKTIQAKGAIAEGQPITFDQAKTMPTRAEAIGTILAMILGPAAQIAGQIIGPAAQIAGQIKTLAEKPPEGAAETAPVPA